MSSFFPSISEQLYFWVPLIFFGHGFGTSWLLFFFFYLKLGAISFSLFMLLLLSLLTPNNFFQIFTSDLYLLSRTVEWQFFSRVV